MIILNAEKVLSIPRKIRAEDIVRSGFRNNFLFQNISNVFNAPKEIMGIIQKFDSVKELRIDDKTKEKLFINENGEVEIPEEKIKVGVEDVFGNKMYEIKKKLKNLIKI